MQSGLVDGLSLDDACNLELCVYKPQKSVVFDGCVLNLHASVAGPHDSSVLRWIIEAM